MKKRKTIIRWTSEPEKIEKLFIKSSHRRPHRKNHKKVRLILEC